MLKPVSIFILGFLFSLGVARSQAAFQSNDGLVEVEIPAGEGWSCLQSRQTQDDTVLTLVKCKLEVDSSFWVLMAKDYALTKKPPKNAKDLCMGLYKKSYEKLYSQLKYLRSEEIVYQSRKAFEVEFSAVHDRLGGIHKLERVLLLPGHILVLSAEGSEADFQARKALSFHWMDGVKFKSLQDAPSPS